MLHGEAFSNHGVDLFLQEPQLRLPFFCLLISFALLLLLFVKIMLRLVGSLCTFAPRAGLHWAPLVVVV